MNDSRASTRLPDVLRRYRFAYLVTTTDRGAPHVVQVRPRLEQGRLVIGGVGKRSCANVASRSMVGLVWPPEHDSDYSLIVDGTASVHDGSVRVSPTRAVLHRAGPGPEAGGSDCVELDCVARVEE